MTEQNIEGIYVKDKNKELKYFVSIKDEKVNFSGIKRIKNEAFRDSNIGESVFFDKELETIEDGAFKNCEDLKLFSCIEEKTENNSETKEPYIEGIKIFQSNSDIFEIQSSAFEGCSRLDTVIFPKCKKLVIEKDAFSGCESLRTVVALCDDIEFTENPFEDCPDYLTFICFKDSRVEKFARENDYRSINAE